MNSIEDGHICRPQILKLMISSFVGGNPTLEVYKGERPPFPYKRESPPLDLGEEKRETMALLHSKKCETLMALN